ncbi:MAG TPA: hypothetical protein DEB36_07960 [Porphyromonadaceae bacterium]|nr:hypothetical protein [Porphyromonadaceae bacterium]
MLMARGATRAYNSGASPGIFAILSMIFTRFTVPVVINATAAFRIIYASLSLEDLREHVKTLMIYQ